MINWDLKIRKSYVTYASNAIVLLCCNPLLSGIKGIIFVATSVGLLQGYIYSFSNVKANFLI